ncbi:MAG TPA: GNAT family N-acetyltransferase [Aequorivita sp.]|nr:GNAT family N-acetyltransferase [Aequorivita sp.]
MVSNRVTDAYIKDLMVRPEFQGQGIGTHLMNMAIKKLKEDRLYMISVVFEEKLIAFYKCFGFNLLYAG